jgi:hypothetical protein
MNLGAVSQGSDICAGGIFDLNAGSSIGEGGGNPNWVVGATFLKNVYSVFRYQPAEIGFAQLSNAAGGSSGECRNLAGLLQQKISTKLRFSIWFPQWDHFFGPPRFFRFSVWQRQW